MNSLQEALEGLADGVKGEIIGDMLYAQLRPPPRHQHALGAVLVDVQGGDPGWWILAEPGIRVSPAGEFSPDVAGWHKEKMPALPEGPITLVPDWVCEVVSKSTRDYDLDIKRPFYANIGVSWLWLVEPEVNMLFVHCLGRGIDDRPKVLKGPTKVRVQPFEKIELDLSKWWT